MLPHPSSVFLVVQLVEKIVINWTEISFFFSNSVVILPAPRNTHFEQILQILYGR